MRPDWSSILHDTGDGNSMTPDIDPSEQPFEYYLAHMLEDRSLTPRRKDNYHRVVSSFQDFLEDRDRSEPGNVDISDVRGFIKHLKEERELKENTIRTRLSPLNKIYKDMNTLGYINGNPVQAVLNQIELDSGSSQRRDITPAEMGSFLKRRCKHPLFLAVFTTQAKTGLRVGETVNLDIRDVHIDHPQVKKEYPALRSELEECPPDTMYITSEITEGGNYRGEIRQEGNKRKRSTFIPIDNELKQVLINYLLIRPSTRVIEKPFFVGIGGCTKRRDQRLTAATIGQQLAWRAENEGWRQDGYHPLNVSPHYFRHFFTTHADERMNDKTIKYLRGDIGDDSKDDYIHYWNNSIRREYLSKIYTLF